MPVFEADRLPGPAATLSAEVDHERPGAIAAARILPQPSAQPRRCRPVPAAPPLVQTLRLALRPLADLEACARRWGDWFTLRLIGGRTNVFCSHPDAVRDVHAGDPETFRGGEAAVDILAAAARPALAARARRRAPSARAPAHVAAVPRRARARLRAAGARERPARVGGLAARPSLPDPPRDADHHARRDPARGLRHRRRTASWSSCGAGWSTFSRSPTGRRRPSSSLPFTQFELARSHPVGSVRAPRPRHRRAPVCRDGPAARRGDRRAAPTSCRSCSTPATSTASRMTDHELRDEMFTLLMAGHETTATSLAWAFYHVLRHPDVRRASARRAAHGARRRADGAGARRPSRVPRRGPEGDAAPDARWSHSPGASSRAPARIGGRELPAGVVVSPAIYLVHRRPDLWPEPERFRPERFVGVRPSPFTFFPFGGGVRRCLGAAFATYEMKVVLGRGRPACRPARRTRATACAPCSARSRTRRPPGCRWCMDARR